MAFDFAAYKRKRAADPVLHRHDLDRDNAARRADRKDNPEKWRLIDAAHYERHKVKWTQRSRYRNYKITPQEWDHMFVGQGGVCAICRSPTPGTKQTWHTDHNHVTGEVRGILCAHCNRMLGAARDNPDWLIEGAKYLEKGRNVPMPAIKLEQGRLPSMT